MMAELMTNEQESEYSIKPQKSTPALNTSEWPLLLKVFVLCILFKNAGIFPIFLSLTNNYLPKY
jgi:hypothetical protein